MHISRSKGNQAMKFGQLIKHNTRNIFLEKSYTKCGGDPRPFSKKIKIEHTVFPLISAGPQISAAPLCIHIEISASL